MCQFLQHQIWHENTEQAISGLTKTSSQVAESLENSSKLQEDIVKNQMETLDYQVCNFPITGCLNAKPDVLNTYKAIKIVLLSHKNGICTFLRCGNLTYDPWIWLKKTSLSSTASVLKDGRISLEIPSFHSEIFLFKNIKIR